MEVNFLEQRSHFHIVRPCETKCDIDIPYFTLYVWWFKLIIHILPLFYIHVDNSDKINQTQVITMCCSRKYPYPSHGRLFSLNPPPPTPLEFPVKPHTFLLKFWLLRPPTPSEFPSTFHGVDMDIFWNCTIQTKSKLYTNNMNKYCCST